MRNCNRGCFREQVRFLQRQFLQDGDLPFTDILSEQAVAKAAAAITTCWLDRIYSPVVTLWVFVSQVLSQDHSCRAAVARLIAHRVSRGQRACSAETGAYCQARKRLPDKQVLLGCARPPGMHKRVTDAYAIMAGLDGIAFPADGAVSVAHTIGRPFEQAHSCCSIKLGSDLKTTLQSSCAA